METYKEQAKQARLKVLEMIYNAQTSHIGSNFSIVDIFTVLFANIDLTKDQVVLSAGWKAAALYYFLAEKGVIDKTELATYCQPGARLIGLTEPGIPGIRFAGGSMQMGLPAAVGFALSKKMKGEDGKVYCIVSDGELAGGMMWEANLIAAHYNLDNLVVFIDKNDLQAMGSAEHILQTGWKKDGWSVHAINGHDYDMIERALRVAHTNFGRPLCFIAQTTKGKGIKVMEGNNVWHYKNIPESLYELFRDELHNG